MTAKQGESTDLFIITVKGVTDYTDYYSDLSILVADTEVVVLGPVRINPVDNKFSVALTPDQTAALPVDSYTVVLEVIKEVTGIKEFRKEISWSLKVTKPLIAV